MDVTSQGTVDAPQAKWGLHAATPGCPRSTFWLSRVRGRIRRSGHTLCAILLAIATMSLTMLGTATATTTPAHADIFGISDAVENWICGLVAPSEPWEAVGSGPDGWLSNRNLADTIPVQSPSTALTPGVTTDTLTIRVPARPNVPTVSSPPEYMDQVQSLPSGTSFTLYEVAGIRGLDWVTIPYTPDGTQRNCSVFASIWNWAANGIFTLNKGLLQVTIAIKETATSDNPLNFLYSEAGGVVSDVFTLVFVPAAIIMLIFSAIWVGAQTLRNNARVGARALLGALGIAVGLAVAGGFLYAAQTPGGSGFQMIASTVDQATAGINDMASQALMARVAKVSGNCDLPEDAPERGQRLTSCVLADAMAYRPWAIGQFGSRGASPIPMPPDVQVLSYEFVDGKPPPEQHQFPVLAVGGSAMPCYVNFAGCKEMRSYLIAQHGGVSIGMSPSGIDGQQICRASVSNNGTLIDFGFGVFMVPFSAACSPMWNVFRVLARTDLASAAAYAGDVGMARVSQALVALTGTLVAALAVLVIAVISMFWQGKVFSGWMIGPFKLGFSVMASKVKLAKEWATDIVHAWLARIAYGIALLVAIVVIVILMQSTLAFGYRIVWLGLILWGFWKLIGKIQAGLRPGVSSAGPDIVDATKNAVTKGGRLTKNAVTQTVQRAGAAADAGLTTIKRRRVVAQANPNRGPLRRGAATLTAPIAVAGSMTRATVTGSASGAKNRLQKTEAKVEKKKTRRETRSSTGGGAINGSREQQPKPGGHVAATSANPVADPVPDPRPTGRSADPAAGTSGISPPPVDRDPNEGGAGVPLNRPQPSQPPPASTPTDNTPIPETAPAPDAAPPPRRRLPIRLPDLDPVPGSAQRISTEPEPAVPAAPLY